MHHWNFGVEYFEISSNIWLCRNVNINEATDYQRRIAWGATDSYQMISGSVDTQIPEGILTERHQEPAIRMGVFSPTIFLGHPKIPSPSCSPPWLGRWIFWASVSNCWRCFAWPPSWWLHPGDQTILDVFWRMGKRSWGFLHRFWWAWCFQAFWHHWGLKICGMM